DAPQRKAVPRDESAALIPRVTSAMVHYSYTRYALYFTGVAADLLVLLFLLRSGASARLREAVERRLSRPAARIALYYLGFSLAYGALVLPLMFYRGWWLEHQ